MATTTKSSTNGDGEEAIKLLRQQKQSLRKQIRSRIKTSYPPTDDNLLVTQSDLVFARLFTLPEYESAKSVGFFLSMPKGEIQTKAAIQKIVKEDGKVLYVPRVGLDFERCDMDLIRCDDTDTDTTTTSRDEEEKEKMFYDGWPRNKWGIPEPPVASDETNVAKPGDIDLLLVPGLAFDMHGHRLGQGKGYYDRFIAKMRDTDDADDADGDGDGIINNGSDDGRKKPMLVGVCLEEQFLEEVPHGIDLGVVNNNNNNGNKGGIIPVSDHDYIMDMVLTPSRTLVVPTK